MPDFQSKSIFRMGEALWVGFGLVASVFALLAGTRILTKLLSTTEYGKLALAVSLTTLAVQVFGNPIGKSAIRFYAYWRKAGKLYGLIRKLCRSTLNTISGIFLFCVVIVIWGYYIEAFPDRNLIILTGIFAILMILNRIAFAFEDAARERKFRSIIQGLFEAGRFLIAVFLIAAFAAPDAEVVLVGFAVAGFFTFIGHSVFLYRLFKPFIVGQPDSKKKIASNDFEIIQSFQRPLIVSSACVWAVMMAERWALKSFGGLGDVGGYAAVYQLAFMPMLLISNFLVLLTEPILYKLVGIKEKTPSSKQAIQTNRFMALVILLASLILFLVLLFCHPIIGYFFLGAEFRSFSWIFPWLLLSGGCFAASQQLLLKLSAELRTGSLALLWCFVASISIVAYMISAYLWQIEGIVFSVVIVNISFVIFLLIFFNKEKLPR